MSKQVQSITQTTQPVNWLRQAAKGGAIMPTPKRQLATIKQTAVTDPEPRIIANPQYNAIQRMQLAAMLASTIQAGVQSFEVAEKLGRVYLIRYVPIASVDPLLPFVFRPYGEAYQKSYSWLNRLFQEFADDPQRWDYAFAESKAKKLIGFVTADKELSQAEKLYYQTRMMFSIAMPHEAK